eukprot:111349_1
MQYFFLNDLTNEYIVYDLNFKIYYQNLAVLDYGLIDACIVSDNENILWAFGGIGYASQIEANGLFYNLSTNYWYGLTVPMNLWRAGIGCNIDKYKKYIYLFGGEAGNNIKTNIIERYSVETLYNISLNPWDETGYKLLKKTAMIHKRSYFHVQVTTNNLFVILGGVEQSILLLLEIFNASNGVEQMVIPPNIIVEPYYKRSKFA